MVTKRKNCIVMPSLSQLAQVLSEDDIKQLKEEIYNEVLDKNRTLLCNKVNPVRHFPLLRQKNVFILSVEQTILAEVTTERQVYKFIDELKRVGGINAFPVFIESIDKTQVHLREKLNKCCDDLQEDIPLHILARSISSVKLEEIQRREPVVHEGNSQPEGFPPIDIERLTEAQETYHRYLTEDEDELEEYMDEHPILDDEEQKMNQL